MRIARAIERYLRQKELDSDFTARTVDSYYRTLVRLADAYPEARLSDFEGRDGKQKVLEVVSRHWGRTSAGTRQNRLSTFNSFFGWAEDEGFMENAPHFKRPPRRRANVYRPPLADRVLAYRATTLRERGPWLLMMARLRASSVVTTRWGDIDLGSGHVDAIVKGQHRDRLRLPPEILEDLRAVYRELEPDPDDYVFTVEIEVWDGPNRIRKLRDPKAPIETARKIQSRTKALWIMTERVCKRAGVRRFGPHALRHGFAVDFLRDSNRDVYALKQLLGHTSLATTEMYLDELTDEELEETLRRVAERRHERSRDRQRDDDAGPVRAKAADGPGRSRTSGPGLSSEHASADRADDPADPHITDPKGGHKHGD